MVCRLQLDDRPWIVELEGGRLEVRSGEPTNPDTSLRTDPKTLNALLEDPNKLDAASADGTAAVTGDHSVFCRLLGSVAAPADAAV